MQQILFNVGVGVPGFGAMLFLTFILATAWGTVRAKRIGMPAIRFQDFTICIFVSGLIARGSST